jgi:hypothetical protein
MEGLQKAHHSNRNRMHVMLTSLYCRSTCPCTGYQWDYIFDWTILKHAHTQNRSVSRNPEALAPEEDPAGAPPAQASGTGGLDAAGDPSSSLRPAPGQDSSRRR